MSCAKTLVLPGLEEALRGIVAGSGTNSPASLERSARDSSSSKTSRAEKAYGCRTSDTSCICSATVPVPSRFLPPTLELHTDGGESSLLPTLTEAADSLAPLMAKVPVRRRMRGTLCAAGHHSNAGGSKPGPIRLTPYGEAAQAGGTLSPTWCDWFMGFPVGWSDLEPGDELSETPSSPSARR